MDGRGPRAKPRVSFPFGPKGEDEQGQLRTLSLERFMRSFGARTFRAVAGADQVDVAVDGTAGGRALDDCGRILRIGLRQPHRGYRP